MINNYIYIDITNKYKIFLEIITKILNESINKQKESETIEIKNSFLIKEMSKKIKINNKNLNVKKINGSIDYITYFRKDEKNIFTMEFEFHNNDNNLNSFEIEFEFDNKIISSKILFLFFEKKNEDISYILNINKNEIYFNIYKEENRAINKSGTDISLIFDYNKIKNKSDFLNIRKISKKDLYYNELEIIKKIQETNPEIITEILFSKDKIENEFIDIFNLNNDINIMDLKKISFPLENHEIIKNNNKKRNTYE